MTLRHIVARAGLALLGLAAACATNPVTGEREFTLMSEAQEIETGRQLDVEVRREMGVYDDDDVQQYVDDLGQRLARNSHRPGLQWYFTVVDVPAVNAFALPGGYIYITRGILAYLDNEAQLAGVLGHEIGHVTARHAVQQYTRATGATLGLLAGSIFVPEVGAFRGLAETGLGVLFLAYGRDDELQADRLGAEYAAATGWDPGQVPVFLTTLGRIEAQSDRQGVPNWAMTHPPAADRVSRVDATVAELKTGEPDASWTVDRDVYLGHVEGIIFGDNPREGIVRGTSFLHPELRFAFEFPEGWRVQNSEEQVIAKMPDRDGYVLLQVVDRPQGRTMADIAAANMRGLRQTAGGETTINGLEAYLGEYRGRVSQLGNVTMRAAHIRSGRTVYFVAGLAPDALYGEIEPALSGSVRSFRALSREEAEAIKPNRVALYTARRGDTWQSIAQRQSQGIVMATTLAIMNGDAVNDQPRPGERLKIVVGE